MSEIIVTFQNQLSGVMETVFKAAIFEITRLVEDSFLEEVSRNREQVESLKKRLQWSESRARRRCVDCGNAAGSSEERQDKEKSLQTSGEKNVQKLKQECVTESWENCDAKNQDSHSVAAEADQRSSPAVTESNVREEEKMENMLKLEAPPTGTKVQDEWKLSSGAEGSGSTPHEKSYSEQELQQIQDEWSAGLNQTPEPEPQADMDHIQGLLYRTRYNMEDLGNYGNPELDMEEINGLTDSAQRELLGFNMMAGSNHSEPGTSEESRKRVKGKRGNKGAQNASDVGGMDCLLINEQGYLQSVSGLPQAAGDVAGNSQEHSLFGKDASGSNSFFAGDAFNQVLALNSRCAEMLGDRESRTHTCSQCMISFQDQTSLKAHMKSHGQQTATPTPHVCNHCGKKFPQACNLKVHQRVHLREGLHLCNHCGKGFAAFSDLRRHRCTPTDDKPYICSLCGNKFRRLWNLKLHRRIHTQEKPHRCGMCDKSFTRADILKIHQRTHTGERPYSCRICGLTFKRLDHLRSHQRKHDNMNNIHLLNPLSQ